MFYTGQASNPLAAKIASDTGYVSHLVEMVRRRYRAGSVLHGHRSLGGDAAESARDPQDARSGRLSRARELAEMGRMRRNEWILAAVFVSVCGMWATSDIHKIDITVTALLGSVALLLTGVLTWEDVKSERAAWDIFVWYGGLLMLGRALNDAQVTTEFARLVGGAFGGLGWPMLFACALGIYFYAHYGFASITAHILAMYPPFLALLLAKGAPVGADDFRLRVLHEPRRRSDQLRHHAVSHVLRA